MAKKIKQYKIKRLSDGLFSTGGTNPKFNLTGKTWSNIGHVKTHMKQGAGRYDDNNKWIYGTVKDVFYSPSDNFEVIEVEYAEILGNRIPLDKL